MMTVCNKKRGESPGFFSCDLLLVTRDKPPCAEVSGDRPPRPNHPRKLHFRGTRYRAPLRRGELCSVVVWGYSPWWRAADNAVRRDCSAICRIFCANVRKFSVSATLSAKICDMYSICVGATIYTSLVMFAGFSRRAVGSRIISPRLSNNFIVLYLFVSSFALYHKVP